MLFRQIVFYGFCIGVCAGLILTLVQQFQVVPIIKAAETYENSDSVGSAFVSEAGHNHAHSHGDSWAPETPFERMVSTSLSNILTATGLSLITLALMLGSRFLPNRQATQVSWKQGLLWALAGYITFWLAPALGLPPEIPLQNAAPLEERQVWWVLTAICTALGLGIAVFTDLPWRLVALLPLVVPHLVGAPHPEGAMFVGQSDEAVRALEVLAMEFFGATAIANFILWLVIGIGGAWSVSKIIPFYRWDADTDSVTHTA